MKNDRHISDAVAILNGHISSFHAAITDVTVGDKFVTFFCAMNSESSISDALSTLELFDTFASDDACILQKYEFIMLCFTVNKLFISSCNVYNTTRKHRTHNADYDFSNTKYVERCFPKQIRTIFDLLNGKCVIFSFFHDTFDQSYSFSCKIDKLSKMSNFVKLCDEIRDAIIIAMHDSCATFFVSVIFILPDEPRFVTPVYDNKFGILFGREIPGPTPTAGSFGP